MFGGVPASNMSWDPTTATRDAMADQLEKLQRTIIAVDPSDTDASEMQRRLQAQIDDLQRRIDGIDSTKRSSAVNQSTSVLAAQAEVRETKSDVTSQTNEEVLAHIVEVQEQLQAEQKKLREDFVAMQREQMMQREVLQKIILAIGSTSPNPSSSTSDW